MFLSVFVSFSYIFVDLYNILLLFFISVEPQRHHDRKAHVCFFPKPNSSFLEVGMDKNK